MREQLLELKEKAEADLERCVDLEALNEFRVSVLGKKGELTKLLKNMGRLSAEERPVIGQLANEIRDQLETRISRFSETLRDQGIQRQIAGETLDVTLPGTDVRTGGRHLLYQVQEEIEDVFIGMGYSVYEGFEIETDYYNFEVMNLPKDHPARDMQDSFYITPEVLLRTHTSPAQNRAMEAMCPNIPVKIIVPGRVYRRDDDATHSPMFHQVEGLLIDEHVRFSDLKGTLLEFARQMFGPEQRIRLRPSYFPFTEPSAEVDISCVMCHGRGCRTCGGTGWLEILGAGMVHPRVLEMGGYDPGKVTGFAFGLGVDRVTMLKYGLDDLRLLFENDVRFLKQF
ncbi:MAG: phenylalanine--tRNA ligase subunit alpha [Peptococcaceae bacterium]|jgi:phenylalanyl-tRNA synthetase alpha chain|nr:phenylalanine--tRNA ligase subunit alpha [Peptococcaceae bacterium]